MQFARFLGALCIAAFCSTAVAQARELPDFTRLVDEQGAAVVNISATRSVRRTQMVPGMDDEEAQEFFRRFIPRQLPGPGQRPESRSVGSGFIISGDGYILTNAHVVDEAEEIVVRFTDKREYKAKVIGADKLTDVALLKIDGSSLPSVKFGDPMRLKVGEWVVAIGAPFGYENSVTAGIVSAKGRSLPQENFVPFIQTDVAINPGNSGGPLFNMRGEVVGINSQIYSRTGGFMGLSFAIPIDVALDVQKQLRDRGRVARGRIGVLIQDVTRDLATSFGLDRPRGALVTSVEKASPAERAGVEASDIILSFNGRPVDAVNDLLRLVASARPGTQAGMEVWRKAAKNSMTITLEERPEDRVAARETPRAAKPAPVAANRLGIVVTEISAEQKKDLKVSGGLVVTDVRPDARVEVRKGDVILMVVQKGQQTELRTVEQFNRLLAGLEKNAVITLQVKRGDGLAFVTVSGFTDKG
ncbi:MAG TPA: DegQ family serine endoprotease [Burkholderiales bacterium]